MRGVYQQANRQLDNQRHPRCKNAKQLTPFPIGLIGGINAEFFDQIMLGGVHIEE